MKSTYMKSKISISEFYDPQPTIIQNSNVPEGKVYISNSYAESTGIDNIIGKKLKIDATSIYYEESKNLEISELYSKKNIEKLLGVKVIDNTWMSSDGTYGGTEEANAIFINPNDYNALYNKGTYQSSVYVKEPLQIEETCKILNDSGITTLKIKDTLINDGGKISIIFTAILDILLVIGLFFISYFVLRVIMKSRNIYFSTIRILGASKKVAKNLLMIELMTITNIAYIAVLILLNLAQKGIINNAVTTYIVGLAKFVTFKDYVILYIILMFISYMVSERFSKRLFKNSSMKTYREEV